MGKPLALLLLACLALGMAHAEQSASFSDSVASLSKDVRVGGHYGNYTLVAQALPGKILVSISGPDENRLALVSELFWLQQEGVFSTLCSFEGVTLPPDGQEAHCDGNGSWAVAGGEVLPPSPEAAGAIAEKKAAMGRAGDDAQAVALSAPAAAPEPQGGIGTEQMLQLLGAFLLVIIASYLILQSRPPNADAGAEKLLENRTRAGIMNELSSADKIPTDISNKLGKSKAAVIEHLQALAEAGLVERVATPGKKFVFYRLTQKGRQTLLKRAG